MSNWIIEHNNGCPGLSGYSESYGSEEEIRAEVEEMTLMGIMVYRFFRI